MKTAFHFGSCLRARNILFVLFAVCSSLLLSVAFFSSLTTPFALIDDYGDWMVVKHWAREGQFQNWFRHVFWGDGLTRYRPFFEMYNYAAWSLFGPSAPLHHLARWVIKLFCLLLGILALARFVDSRDNQPRGSSGRNREELLWTALLLGTIFLFIPNQPDARLAPQELNTVFFLALVNLSMANLLTTCPDRLIGSSPMTGAMLLVGCLGLSLTKEINIAIIAWILVFLSVAIRPGELFRQLVILAPLGCVFGFTLWRVKVAAGNAIYGSTDISIELLRSNFKWLYKDVFQFSTSLVIGCILLVLFFWPIARTVIRGLRSSDISRQGWFIILVFGEFIVIFSMLCTSWQQVLRYWYPLVPLLALLAAISASMGLRCVEDRSKRCLVQAMVLVFCLVFVMTNSHNYLLQYATQHSLRNMETQALDRAARMMEQGDIVHVWVDSQDPDMEVNDKILIYFNHYLPFFHDLELDLRPVRNPEEIRDAGFLVSPRHDIQEFQRAEAFIPRQQYPLLDATRPVSAALQLRKNPRIRLDSGVHGPGYALSFHQRQGEPFIMR